jgi:hypothetical protein
LLEPDARLIARFGIPRSALRTAFGPGSEHRRIVAAVVEPVRALCEQHELFRPHHAAWWRALELLS